MGNNFPENIYAHYRMNASEFEERVDSMKRTLYYALLAVCVMLIIHPAIIPVGSIAVYAVAGIGILYILIFGLPNTKDFYNKRSGGKITDAAIKKFAKPERGSEAGGPDDQKITSMFENGDWEGLAGEPEAGDRPLQLVINEDSEGQTFYLMLMRYFSPSDFRGVSEVKEIKGAEYTKWRSVIKGIKST